ncbi:hypothetical protein [Pimelobacter simplex]|uniref:hypothetical protein n=1 Tax=Nocardioides simplex TaxID=2045 RepID=UPI00214F6DC4|nr:hypothetical protein [Pimelobacter simplex]UUW90186.1 hypothetical protein M0M43_01505 [Pimelobacter simplex]UUW94015.1 hypothetical protein M0M48_20015 [Pimelobacter simplex]
MSSRRGPAAVLALGAATLVLLAGITPAMADDPTPTPAVPASPAPTAAVETPTPETPTPEPTPSPEADPTPTPTPSPEAEPAPEKASAPAAARPAGITLTPETASTVAGEPASFAVWSVDADGTRLREVTAEADYEVVGGGSCTAGSCTTTRAGVAVVKARWDRFSAVAGLQVTPGPTAGITLKPTAASIGIGDAQVFSALRVDRYGNRTELAYTVDYTASGGLACLASGHSARCEPTTPGTYTVTVTDPSDPAVTASATLTVGGHVLNGLSVTGPPGPVSAGTPFAVTAAGRTPLGNTLDVTDRAAFRVAPVDDHGVTDLGASVTCPAATCTLDRAGRYSVVALLDDPTLSATTEVEVAPGAPTGLVVSPAEAAVTASASQDFRAALVDSFGNRTPAPGATYTIGAPGICTDNACTAATAGTYTVTATEGGRTATATLRVHPDERPTAGIARIEVAPTAASTPAGAPGTFVVRAYAADGLPLGTVTDNARLTIEGAGTLRTPFGERSLRCTGATCTSTAAGRHTVTAHLGDLTATTTFVVVSDGNRVATGLAPSAAVIRAGETQAFAPGILDTYGNLAEGSTGIDALELQASAGASCTGTVCGSTRAGVYVIRIGGLNGQPVNEEFQWLYTALLIVVPGPTDRIGLDPATATVPAGEAVDLTATAYDAYDNVIGDVTDRTAFAPGPGATCVAQRCSSTVAATYPVTGTLDGRSAEARLTVVAGPVDRITLSPGRATIEAGRTRAFTAAGFDAYGNETGDLTGATTFTSTAPGTCSANACGATSAGDLTVTGSYVVPAPAAPERLASGRFGALLAAPGDTVTGTATLTVTPRDPGTPGTPGTPEGPGDGASDGNAGHGGGGNPADGSGSGTADAGALPATGSAVDGRYGLLAVLLLAAGAVCLRRARRA